jgi:hypothetical protein
VVGKEQYVISYPQRLVHLRIKPHSMDIETTLQAILDRQLVIYRRLVLLSEKGKMGYTFHNAEKDLKKEVEDLKTKIIKSDGGTLPHG